MVVVLAAWAVSQRGYVLGGAGGDGGGIIPPLPGPAAQGPHNAPTLSGTGSVVVLLAINAEFPGRRLPRVAIIRLGSELLGVARLTPGVPAVFTVPDVEAIQLDVLGTDALGVPVVAGSVVRVVVP